MDTTKILEIPTNDIFVQTLRSASSRWAFLAMVLMMKESQSAEKARELLLKRYRDLILKKLPHLADDQRKALANEIVTADADYFSVTLDIDKLRDVLKETPLTPLPLGVPTLGEAEVQMQSVAPMQSAGELAAEPERDSLTTDTVEPESEEERELFHSIIAGLALTQLRSNKQFNRNFGYVDGNLGHLIESLCPALDQKAVARFLGYAKKTAGGYFTLEDDSADIPY